MWDQIFKKKQALGPGGPKKNEEADEEVIEAPEVDETLAKMEAALKESQRLADKQRKEEAREARRQREQDRNDGSFGGSCGCG